MSVIRPLPLDSIQVSCDTSVLNMDIQLSPVTRSSSTVQCLLSTSHLSLLITILMFESVNLLVTAVVISDKNQRVKSPTLTFITAKRPDKRTLALFQNLAQEKTPCMYLSQM